MFPDYESLFSLFNFSAGDHRWPKGQTHKDYRKPNFCLACAKETPHKKLYRNYIHDVPGWVAKKAYPVKICSVCGEVLYPNGMLDELFREGRVEV